VDSIGASGGILLMWDRRVVTKIEVCLGNYLAACSFRNVGDGLLWAFAGCMVLLATALEGFCGKNWQGC
jgi:hypothetical protein